MKTLNRILIGTVLLATLFSCQDVVTYNDGYDDGMNSFGAPDVQEKQKEWPSLQL